jgi:hypothetical protein
MAGTDSYGQGIVVAQLLDAPDAETLARNIADALAQRSIMRFASATARAATLTGQTPAVAGMVTYLQDVKRLEFYTGSAWSPLSASLMDWTALNAVGSYSSGFGASTPPPRMRKYVEVGTEVWEYEGAISITTLPVETTTTMFTFGSTHRPTSGRGFTAYNSSHYGARVTIAPDGKLSISVPSGAGVNVSKVWLDGIRITNPTA